MSPLPSLTSLLGGSTRVELLELLAEYVDEEVSVPFLQEHINSSPASIYKYIKELVKDGLVVETRKVGTAQYYTLNLDNEGACVISYIHNTLLSNEHIGEIHARDELTIAEEILDLKPKPPKPLTGKTTWRVVSEIVDVTSAQSQPTTTGTVTSSSIPLQLYSSGSQESVEVQYVR